MTGWEGLRTALVLIHIVGFALLFGGWASQVFTRSYRVTTVIRSGLGVMIASGLLLAIPFPDDVHLDYLKLGVKLVIALGIGALFGVCLTREKAGRPSRIAFWAIGVLAIVNAVIAFFWH